MHNDITMIGHICKDTMYDMGTRSEGLGGAVYYSSIAAARSGKSIHVITMAADADDHLLDVMRNEGITVTRIPASGTTQITLRYNSSDREKREIILGTQAEPFCRDGFPVTQSSIFHLAGLFKGEIPDNFIPYLAEKGKVALDVQGVLRCSEDKKLVFRQWEAAEAFLPYIEYLKTDAAEAEVLTGCKDRTKAALALASMGPREVMVTHNEEVLICSNGDIIKAPFNPNNLSGRTGRGDTTFAAYITKRLDSEPQEALYYSAALCSIKMESPGPFNGSINDVYCRMADLGYKPKSNN